MSVRILPTLAIRWFIPHFPSFQKQCPDVRVSISTSMEPPDFEKDGVDIGITRMPSRIPSIRSELFALEELVLVGNRSIMEPLIQKGGLDSLADHTWLVADSRPDTWQSWLEAMGLAELQAKSVLHFEQLNMA
ncbi:MAG: LysR substrate-binding domain-containing protein, partial [Methylotenera sp.]